MPQLSFALQSFAAEGPVDATGLVEQVAGLEAAGVDRVAVSDHVVFGERLEEYGRPEVGGTVGGRQPTGPDGHWLEPLTLLTYMAARTERIRLATNILLAALRRPVVLAKTASTLDFLSGGRLDIGVGVGWQREEYEAAGLDFGSRGRILDETLRVCQTLWREERASYHSSTLDFEAIHMMPKPVQPGGVPLWISGTVNPRVVSRLAEFGAGWIPWGDAAADLLTGLATMGAALAEHGRELRDLQVVANVRTHRSGDGVDVTATLEPVADLVAAGATDIRLSTRLPAGRQATADYVGPLVEAFRSATA